MQNVNTDRDKEGEEVKGRGGSWIKENVEE